jgi:hypothetical protein
VPGVRQAINDKPVRTAVLAGTLFLGILLFVLVRGCPSTLVDTGEAAAPTHSFFSTDDGRTYFVDDARHVPPYTVNKPGDPNDGKTAWGARVARCGEGGKPFVWALEKYGDADQRKLESLMSRQGDRAAGLPKTWMGGMNALLKRPGAGDKGWVKFDPANPQQYAELARPRCPDGGAARVVNAE